MQLNDTLVVTKLNHFAHKTRKTLNLIDNLLKKKSSSQF
ncbi:hypothetical protein [Leuconostoc gelidum]